jgi:cyclohexadienyl dehydratase
VHVIVNPRGTNERFDRAHLQNATIVQWSDNATIFDALVESKADLMITDVVEMRVQRSCIRASSAPSIRTRRSTIRNSPTGCYAIQSSQAYVNQWLNLLDLSGEHQAVLALWTP